MGRGWPRESRHCDGISILSGSILKKLMTDFINYLNDESLKLSYDKFLKVCGLQSPSEMMVGLNKEISAIANKVNPKRNDCNEIELYPSDRPAETTIITLKRFECIDVLDVDEVEEEGIQEDDYFSAEQVVAGLISPVKIKPGHVVSVALKLNYMTEVDMRGKWCLVHKNIHFGSSIIKAEDKDANTDNKKRISHAKQCQVSRQIVQINSSKKPNKDSMSKFEMIHITSVKILNPSDSEIVLEVGDDVALVRVEKEANPDDPKAKTYSQIKSEAIQSVQDVYNPEEPSEENDEEENSSRKRRRSNQDEHTAKKVKEIETETIESEEDIGIKDL